MQDTWETEIYRELLEVMEERDIVLGKHGSSMFEGTNLDKLLKSMGGPLRDHHRGSHRLLRRGYRALRL